MSIRSLKARAYRVSPHQREMHHVMAECRKIRRRVAAVNLGAIRRKFKL